jgi:hypothetical protein
MEKEILVKVRKAFYSCSCSIEYPTDDIDPICPVCKIDGGYFYLTRVSEFYAIRNVVADGMREYITYR